MIQALSSSTHQTTPKAPWPMGLSPWGTVDEELELLDVEDDDVELNDPLVA